jgi:dolichol-phosphate mannosyltransferase
MVTTRTIHVVLPAYEEAEGLPVLLADLEALAPRLDGALRVVVVDDGSVDATSTVAASFQGRLALTVLRHERNQGLGATLRTGLAAVGPVLAPGDLVVTMDSDATHPVETLPDMLAAIDGGADIVIASRFRPGSRVAGLPRHRSVLSAGVRFAGQLIVGLPGVRDYTCGYRVIRGDLLARALRDHGGPPIAETGFSATIELLLALGRYRPVVREVPFTLRYDLKRSTSKLRIGRTMARTLGVMARFRRGRR